MAVSSIRFVGMYVYGSSSNERSRTVFFRIRAGFRNSDNCVYKVVPSGNSSICRFIRDEYPADIRQIPPPPRSSTRRVLHVVGCTKRKCGAVFVHLQRGSDKTQNRINECFTPHLNRYENCGAKLFWPNLSKQENECCSLPRFTLKLSDFFVRTEWKTLSVCLSVCDRTKLENNFRIEQHSLWKFHANFHKKVFFL